jgi:hypothetical protein
VFIGGKMLRVTGDFERIVEFMGNGGVLADELQGYYRQIEQVKMDAEELIQGLDDDQFNWRPSEQRWSIGDCLEHLNVTSRLYWPVMTQAMMHSRMNGLMSPGPFKHPWLGNLFVRTMEPPVRKRFKASRKFSPLQNQPLPLVWSQFVNFQDRMLEMIREANGVDLARTKLQSPAFKLIKLTLGQAFGLVTAHERRHVWQAQEVKKDVNFPA